MLYYIEMEMLLEYITLSSKLIKLPRHKRRLAELHEALTSGRDAEGVASKRRNRTAEAVAPEVEQRDKHSGRFLPVVRQITPRHTPYPYTADEIKKDFDQRVFDGTAQRTPW